MVYSVGADIPCIDDSVFIAWNAVVAGNVIIGPDSSVWFSVTIREGISPIVIGKSTNIQDGSVLHVETGIPCIVGDNVTVGHGVILHSCIVGNGSLIGMGAILLNESEIGEGSIVAAGSLVTTGKKFPPRSLIMGSPAKLVGEIDDDTFAENIRTAERYVKRCADAKKDYHEITGRW